MAEFRKNEHKKYIDFQYDSVCLLNPSALVNTDCSHDHLNLFHKIVFNVCNNCCREPTIVNLVKLPNLVEENVAGAS